MRLFGTAESRFSQTSVSLHTLVKPTGEAEIIPKHDYPSLRSALSVHLKQMNTSNSVNSERQGLLPSSPVHRDSDD